MYTEWAKLSLKLKKIIKKEEIIIQKYDMQERASEACQKIWKKKTGCLENWH